MEHKLQHPKQYRFFTSGDVKSPKLLIVLHGYGQLPEYFIRKFNYLTNEYFIVAPEGMHRFYLNGTAGRVGASWMTKESREDDIKDNISFLNQLLTTITNENDYESITILGFSQGGATAARWFYQLNNDSINLILWASIFPPDLDLSAEVKSTSNQSNHFVLGTKDIYFDQAAQEKTLAFYQDINYNIHTFDGDHDIDPETLKNLL